MKPLYYKCNEWGCPPHPLFQTIFSDLMSLDWLQATEARQEYFMSTINRTYKYGKGENEREYSSKPYHPSVLWLQEQLNVFCGTTYNVCFLNRYDTKKHQLGWHSDDSPHMDLAHPISVISFGGEREIWWRLKSDKGTVPLEQRRRLEFGSLFVMPAGFQEKYVHRIPRSDKEVLTRISLTFRRYV